MSSASIPLGLGPDRRVARALGDLCAGEAVAVFAGGGAAVGLAGEMIDPARLEGLRRLGSPRLILSRRRAQFLRLRLYGEAGALLQIDPAWNARFVLSLTDAALDFDTGLRGPLMALRQEPSQAAIGLQRLVRAAGLLPAALFIAAEVGEARAVAAAARLSVIDEDALGALSAEPALSEPKLVTSARLPVRGAEKARLYAFRVTAGAGAGEEHLALVIGSEVDDKAPLVRLHSECLTGDLLGSLKCDCGDQLRGAIARISEDGAGILLYLRQEGRGIGLTNKLRAYRLQDQGLDTVEANERLGFADDERSFTVAAGMLRALGQTRVRLLTNNPRKVEGLSAYGITIAERVGHAFPANAHNAHYLDVKRAKSGHFL